MAPFLSDAAPRRDGLTVFVRGLKVQAGIGVYDHEHGRLQTLVIDVTLELDAAGPAIERLSDTINYETVAQAARDIVAEGHVGLVESFAERLALDCLQDARVRSCVVRIEKPGALDAAAAAGCEVAYAR